MTVIAMSIEPDAFGERYATDLAIALGLEYVDHRRLETNLAEQSDHGDGEVHRFVDNRGRLLNPWRITNSQLATRMKEETLHTAARGNVLIVGSSAPAILRPLRQVACICIRSTMEFREWDVMRRLAYNDIRMAKWEIASADALLARFMRRLFDTQWLEPDHYDLIVNTQRISRPDFVALALQLTRSPQYRPTTEMHAVFAAELRSLHTLEMATDLHAATGDGAMGHGTHQQAVGTVTQSGNRPILQSREDLRPRAQHPRE